MRRLIYLLIGKVIHQAIDDTEHGQKMSRTLDAEEWRNRWMPSVPHPSAEECRIREPWDWPD